MRREQRAGVPAARARVLAGETLRTRDKPENSLVFRMTAPPAAFEIALIARVAARGRPLLSAILSYSEARFKLREPMNRPDRFPDAPSSFCEGPAQANAPLSSRS